MCKNTFSQCIYNTLCKAFDTNETEINHTPAIKKRYKFTVYRRYLYQVNNFVCIFFIVK